MPDLPHLAGVDDDGGGEDEGGEGDDLGGQGEVGVRVG